MGKEAASLGVEFGNFCHFGLAKLKVEDIEVFDDARLVYRLGKAMQLQQTSGLVRPFAARGHVLSPVGMWSIYQPGKPLIR